MAFGHGIASKFYFWKADMTPYLEDIEQDLERDAAPYRPMSTAAVGHEMGHKSAVITLGGLYDPAEGAADELAWDVFDAAAGMARPFAFLPQGDARGRFGYIGSSNVDSEQITAGDDVVRMPVGCVGSTDVRRAVILHALEEESATGAETSVDNTTDTADGGDAVLICTAIDAAATLDVLIEGSANNSDWSTLVTFSQLTAAGGEHKAITAAVPRYLRASWTLSADDSATFFVAFGRAKIE